MTHRFWSRAICALLVVALALTTACSGNTPAATTAAATTAAAATNSAFVSLNYYNVRTKRYEVARSVPQRLVFVSDEAASTENTAVVVTAEPSGASGKGAATAGGLAEGPVKLRFAPSEASPVVVILPAGTPLVERARSNGWRRMESPRGIGWTR